MSVNLLMFNPTTTNFLLLDLPKQLAKADKPSFLVQPDVSLSNVT